MKTKFTFKPHLAKTQKKQS